MSAKRAREAKRAAAVAGEPEDEDRPFRGQPRALCGGQPSATSGDIGRDAGAAAASAGVFADAGVGVGVPRCYEDSVARLQAQQDEAALAELALRVEQGHRERTAAAQAAEAAAHAEQACAAGRPQGRAGGCPAAASGGETVIDLCSDEEPPTPASKRARVEPRRPAAPAAVSAPGPGPPQEPSAPLPASGRACAERHEAAEPARAPAGAQSSARPSARLASTRACEGIAGRKTVSGTCGVSPLAAARRDGSAPVGREQASKPDAGDASWMFGGAPALHCCAAVTQPQRLLAEGPCAACSALKAMLRHALAADEPRCCGILTGFSDLLRQSAHIALQPPGVRGATNAWRRRGGRICAAGGRGRGHDAAPDRAGVRAGRRPRPAQGKHRPGHRCALHQPPN